MGQRVIFGVDARALAGSAAVAAFATIALVAIWGSTPVTYPDTMSHLELARDLADGRLEAMPNAAPGYALVLILTRSADVPGVNLLLAQIVMCWLTIFFVLKLVSRYGASWKWLIVLTALMVAPPMMEPVFNAATETTATFLLVAGTTAAMCWYDSRRLRWLGAAGALFGLSALVRPSFQLVAVVLGAAAGIVVWRQRRSLASLAAVVAVSLAGTVVLVGGVSAYNGARFDYPGLTPLAGWHLMTRTGGFLDDIPDSDAALRTSLITLRNSQMIAPGNTPTPNRMLWRSRWQVEQATGLSPR